LQGAAGDRADARPEARSRPQGDHEPRQGGLMTYSAPLKDMRFVLEHVAELDQIARLPGGDVAQAELVGQILSEASALAEKEVAPLSRRGDEEGSRLENGVVRTPQGWREAYRKYVDGGWNSLTFDPDFGGQGVPWLVATAVNEMWQSANMAFALCP